MNNCRVCEHGPEELDWSLSNVAIGAIVDCSEASVRRHKKHSEDPELVAGLETPSDAVNWIPRRKWMSASGELMYSYQNGDLGASASPEEIHVDNERIDSLILDWPEPTGEQDFDGAPEFAFPADAQIGKAGEAGGGTPETIQRFMASIENVAYRWGRNKPTEGYLCDMGDLVENIYSTPSQLSTNDRSLPQQLEDAQAMYMNAIGRLRGVVGTLHVAMQTSNHGEARSAPKVNPYGSENDWGLHILRLLQTRCEDRGWDNVVFHRPAKNEDTTVITTSDGTKVALNHGHHSGTPAGVKKWVTNQIVGRRPGWDANLHVLGHYHHPYQFPIGDGRTVFGTPALDGGSAWFTRKSGEVSPPGIMCLTVAHGGWSNYSIL